jgi:hypothetical protein
LARKRTGSDDVVDGFGVLFAEVTVFIRVESMATPPIRGPVAFPHSKPQENLDSKRCPSFSDPAASRNRVRGHL